MRSYNIREAVRNLPAVGSGTFLHPRRVAAGHRPRRAQAAADPGRAMGPRIGYPDAGRQSGSSRMVRAIGSTSTTTWRKSVVTTWNR